jgi:hypothetical protein
MDADGLSWSGLKRLVWHEEPTSSPFFFAEKNLLSLSTEVLGVSSFFRL